MNPLVLMSDFGMKEQFVSVMKGVAITINPEIKIYDLTHQIPPFNVWEAALTLYNTINYWPSSTVFVSVIDPGVGTDRKSIVTKTKSNHYIISPDNGTLTFIADGGGIGVIRVIDETRHRRPGSEDYHTFHGRDVYVYTGAKLASGVIRYEDVGPLFTGEIVKIDYYKAQLKKGVIQGTVMKIEEPFGNLVTNIPLELMKKIPGLDYNIELYVEIWEKGQLRYKETLPYIRSFGFTAESSPLIYTDSADYTGIALNRGNFAERYQIYSGPDWLIKISRP
jgi:S-adenosylmethionine hydrolase